MHVHICMYFPKEAGTLNRSWDPHLDACMCIAALYLLHVRSLEVRVFHRHLGALAGCGVRAILLLARRCECLCAHLCAHKWSQQLCNPIGCNDRRCSRTYKQTCRQTI